MHCGFSVAARAATRLPRHSAFKAAVRRRLRQPCLPQEAPAVECICGEPLDVCIMDRELCIADVSYFHHNRIDLRARAGVSAGAAASA